MKSILLFFLLSITTLYSSEKISTEKSLSLEYNSTISPYFTSHKLHYFDTQDGLKIGYKIFNVKAPKATIVISSGRTEGMVKYQEFIYDLTQNGYSVYILDHRGQGYSSRLLKDTQIGHVKDYNNYIKDLHYFVKNIVQRKRKLILIAHSMGGAIASVYVERYQDDFDALVLSSPMHQPEIISNSLSSLGCKIAKKRENDIDRYIIGEGSYDDKTPFDKNILTHSKLRYKIADEAYEKEPETKLGGPSVRWLAEACKMSEESVSNAKDIKIPVLLLQAGDDKVVNKEAQDRFCEDASSYCQKIVIDGAYHELFIEKDDMRSKALKAILEFIPKV